MRTTCNKNMLSFAFTIAMTAVGVSVAADGAAASGKPNILLIITDQQHAGMLGCAGNAYLKTPNIDSLATTGARFERAYCGNPVCVPSRFCMMSGTMPSRIGMESNAEIGNNVAQEIFESSMGAVFRRAGYQTVYGGKTHVPGSGKKGQIEPYGFDVITADSRSELSETAAVFLRAKHEKPFLLVASFINPHDICYMAIRAWKNSGTVPKGAKVTPLAGDAIRCLDEALSFPPGMSEDEFFRTMCPPVPANYAIPDGELSAFSEKQAGFRGYVRDKWTERDWRLHRWAYLKLTERVDREIGNVLAALRESGLEEKTLVIFVSDHGDMDSAHRFEHKALLYEEAVRVPFIVSWKGVTSAGLVDRNHLVSTGLDLIPTMCDFAGVEVPRSLTGRSVKRLAEGKPVKDWRNCLVVENYLARLLLVDNWKYMVGGSGTVREMITDLSRDPGELRNLAQDPTYGGHLAKGRRLLKEWYAEQGLALDTRYIVEH